MDWADDRATDICNVGLYDEPSAVDIAGALRLAKYEGQKEGRIAGLKEAAEIVLDTARRQREFGLNAKADDLAAVYVPIQQRISSLSPEKGK